MNRFVVIAALAVLAAGCSSTKVSPVEPYGQDTFVVYVKAKSVAQAHTEGVNAANTYCEKSGKKMVPAKDKKLARREFEFTFSCQ